MQKLLSGTLLGIADGLFGYYILEVSVDATVSDGLVPLFTVVGKHVICEVAIVAVIVPDCNAMMQCKLLKILLCSDSLVRGEVVHEVDTLDAGEMIEKNGGGSEALRGKFSF